MPFRPAAFAQRATLEEWMDGPCAFEDYRDCVADLEQANRWLRGYGPTFRWIRQFVHRHGGPIHLLDVGSGGGGMLRELEGQPMWRGRESRLVGIDVSRHAARAAREASPAGSRIVWFTGTSDVYPVDPPVDLVVSSLFTHHLPEAEIVRFLAWMERTAQGGWFVSDLYRSAISFHFFRVLARLARWHRFVQHDGPISVRRGFREEDWGRMCRSAGIPEGLVVMRRTLLGRLCVSRVKR